MLDKPSAKDWTESSRNRGKPGPRANGPASGFLVKGCADDREAARNQQRRPDTLNTTRHHKLLDARSQTASRGSCGEDPYAHEEHPSPPEQIAKRTARKDQRGQEESIRLDDPLHVNHGCMECGLQCGYGHIDT